MNRLNYGFEIFKGKLDQRVFKCRKAKLSWPFNIKN